MDLFLAICQGLGLALAAGVGGLLALLLISVLAHVEIGWDLDGTDFQWFAGEWLILVLFVLNIGAFVLARSSVPRARVFQSLRVVVTALGAVAFAASLAEETSTWWPGLLAGGAVTAGAALVTESVLAGASKRSEDTAGTMALIAAGAGIVLVFAALFLPPVSLLAAAGLAVLAAGRRRRAGEKYEGLRSLR
ncbi:MAG: DUF4126 family protein [Solirubrobacterales bacterium]